MNEKAVRITCRFCGEKSFLTRVPKYDGFRKTGEELRCAACRALYEGESDAPARGPDTPAVFSEEDRPKPVTVFSASDKGRLCRYCKHYVVNPFTQRCALHEKEVEATDSCPRFDAAPAPKE